MLRHVCQGEPTATAPFYRLEQLLSNTASLLCGAVYAAPETFRGHLAIDVPTQHEAALIARRTADGFRASLADRDHAILAWPWDHIATRVAWLGTQAGELQEDQLGHRVECIAGAYALFHEQQLAAAIDLWRQVVAGVTNAAEPPDLAAMGLQLYFTFERSPAA